MLGQASTSAKQRIRVAYLEVTGRRLTRKRYLGKGVGMTNLEVKSMGEGVERTVHDETRRGDAGGHSALRQYVR